MKLPRNPLILEAILNNILNWKFSYTYKYSDIFLLSSSYLVVIYKHLLFIILYICDIKYTTMSNEAPKPKLLRFDSQKTMDRINEIAEHQKNNVTGTILFVINDYYEKVFKAK